MTKSELKTGMWVELRNGDNYMVVRDCDTLLYNHEDLCFICDGQFILGSSFREDLTLAHGCRDEHDVILIRAYNGIGTRTYKPIFSDMKIVWKRSETEEMTLEQVCKELGREIKIVG